MDSGDKATNKAMSIAFKYACFQVFCIPTEEMVDPDAEGHTLPPKQGDSGKGQKKQPAKKGTEPTDNKTSGAAPAKRITQEEIEAIKGQVENYSARGLKMEKILKMYQIKDIAEMSADQYQDCMNKLKLYEKEETAHE